MARIIRTIIQLVLLSLVVYAASFLGYLYPWINQLSFWLIVSAVIYLSYRSITAASMIVLLELALGNKGYLFSENVFGQLVSIRQAIFAIVILAAVYHIVRTRKFILWKSSYRWWFLIFGLFVGFGVINGFLRNDHTVWFYDLNAYLFFLLIVPFSQGIITRQHVQRAIIWLAAVGIALSIMTIVIAAIFGTVYYRPGFINATQVDEAQLAKLSEIATAPENARLGQTTRPRVDQYHFNWGDISPERPIVYRWLRDTGTAETAYLGGRVFRVFFSSHLYLIAGLFIGLALISRLDRWWRSKTFWLAAGGLALILIALLISFSRSLWLGAAAGFIVVLFLIGKKSALRLVGLGVASIAIMLLSAFIALPSLSSAITQRFQATASPTTEVAASNRLQLLPAVLEKLKSRPVLGSGFGTMVTYRTIVAGTDQLEFVRVYLYEWAYLDIAVKIGSLGLLGYLLFLSKIVRNAWLARTQRSTLDQVATIGLLGLLTCIITANVFTPYLNHPLGIGAILFIAVVGEILSHRNESLDD